MLDHRVSMLLMPQLHQLNLQGWIGVCKEALLHARLKAGIRI